MTDQRRLIPARPEQEYVHDMEFAQGSQWGAVVLQLTQDRDKRRCLQRDPEAIRCHETDYSPADIWLSGRMYSDVQLGMMDGPGRYHPKRDPLHPDAIPGRTERGRMTKRQRKAARKQRRADTRAQKALAERTRKELGL